MNSIFDGRLAIGVFLGLSVAIYSIVFLDIHQSITDYPEFVSALIGAAVGGALAVMGTLISMQQIEDNRINDDMRRKVDLGYSLLQKCRDAYNHSFDYHQILCKQFNSLHQNVQGNPLLSVLNTQSPHFVHDAPVFETSEKSLGMIWGDWDLVNCLDLIEAQANTLAAAVSQYDAERSALVSILPGDFDKRIKYYMGNQIFMSGIRVPMLKAHSTLVQLLPKIEKDMDFFEETLERLVYNIELSFDISLPLISAKTKEPIYRRPPNKEGGKVQQA